MKEKRFFYFHWEKPVPLGESALLQAISYTPFTFLKKIFHHPKKHKTFTIIELLVVIAIISILASLLMPALKKARDKANAVLCTSKLKQIHKSIIFYAGDHDGILPSGNDGICNAWMLDLLFCGYLERNMWLCPGNRFYLTESNKINYAYNDNLSFCRLHSVRQTSQTVMVSDSRTFTGAHFLISSHTIYLDPSNLNCRVLAVHNGGLNFTFMDGHVDWFKEGIPKTSWWTPSKD